MAKLTLAEAQDRVLESALSHTNLLLGHENACFAAISREFTSRVPEIRHLTVRGVRDNADERARWVQLHTDAVAACLDPVAKLGRLSADRAVQSVRRELRACEGALPARYRGIADRAVNRVQVDAIVDQRLEQYQVAVAQYPAVYADDQDQALAEAENLLDLIARLFYLEPGNGYGRGVWWRSVSGVQEKARWVSLAVSNTVRLDAMDRFNQ